MNLNNRFSSLQHEHIDGFCKYVYLKTTLYNKETG